MARTQDSLLEQDGSETSVKGTDSLILQHLAETTDKSIGVCGLGNETDTGGLKRTEGNVGEEFCEGGRSQVDGCAVVGGSLVTEEVDGLLLEEFVTSELERALKEVSSSSRTETGRQSTDTLLGDDLAETTNQSFVVCDGIELYSSLDAVETVC